MPAPRSTAAVISLVALLACAGASHAADAPVADARFAVEPLLPGDDDSGRRLEAALLVRDLRAYRAEGERQRARLRRTPPGETLLVPEEQRRVFGFDPLEELGRFVELADPGGTAPLAAAAAIVSSPEGSGLELLFRAAPGFADRVAEARASSAPPPWAGPPGGAALRLGFDGRTFTGGQDADGWVRLAAGEEPPVTGPSGGPLFSPALASRLGDCGEVLYLRGGGRLAAALAGGEKGGVAGGMLAAANGLAVCLARDDAGAAEVRLLLDHPLLAQLGPALAPPGADAPFFHLWGLDASDFLTLRLPPLVLGAGIPTLLRRLETSGHPPPPAVLAALPAFDGTLGLARFGTPGDWAVGLHFLDEETPAALVPALQPWLAELGAVEGGELARALAGAAVPAAGGSALTFAPDSGLADLSVFSAGRFLLLASQPGRRESLLAAAAGRRQDAPPALDGRLREAFGRPALLSAHKVLGGELAAFGGSGLLALLAREGARTGAEAGEEPPLGGPAADFVAAAFEQLPALLRLAEAEFDLTYDVGLRLEADGGLLTLRLVSSELPAEGPYLDAVNRKFSGDRAGYFDGLMAIARDDAGSRTGRRARATLLYNPMNEVAVVGILAAIAIPNYLNYKAKAARAEAPATLRALREELLAHERAEGRPCASLEACGIDLGGRRWLYFVGEGDGQVGGGDGVADRDALLTRARARLAELGVAPGPAGEGVLAAAVGEPAGAGATEVWAIGREGEPFEVRPGPGPEAVAPPDPDAR